MNVIELLDPGVSVRVAQTLLHFLWQGLLIAVVVAAVNVAGRRKSAAFRYRVAAAAMLLMATCLPVTFLALAPETLQVVEQPRPSSENSEVSGSQNERDFDAPVSLEAVPLAVAPQMPEPAAKAVAWPLQTPAEFLASAAPYIVAAYLAGVLLMMTRLAFAFAGGERLRRSAVPIENATLLKMFADKAKGFGMCVMPAIRCCERVATPIIVGVFKPMILLPVCIMTELSPAQLEAVLAHELAHLRRWDHVANVIQRIIESLLFFHPAVWYVSRCASKERENCCDDMVVAHGTEATSYAELLVRISELSQSWPVPSAATLAATGGKPTRLRERVLRLLGGTVQTPFRLRRAVASAAVVTVSIIAIGVLCIHAAGVADRRLDDFDFNNPPGAYEKEIRVADARQSIKAGSLRFQLSQFTRNNDGSLTADLGTADGYEVVEVRLFDHRKRELLHGSHWELNKENDPSTRRFRVERIGETARITIRETGGELPAEIDLWLRVVENGRRDRIVVPAKQGAVARHGKSEIVVTSLLPGSMNGRGADATGEMIWDLSSVRNKNWRTTVDLQNRGADLQGRYHLVAVTKSGWRQAMDHKHFLDFPMHLGRHQYVLLDVGLNDIDHFELLPFKERHKFFFSAVSVPPPLPKIGVTVERHLHSGLSFIDLETGQTAVAPSLPRGETLNTGLGDWARNQGMDGTLWLSSVDDHVVDAAIQGIDLFGAPAPDIHWDQLTADELDKRLEEAWRESRRARGAKSLATLRQRGEDPRNVAWLFETREGARGILQITEFTDEPQGFKLRYKLMNQGLKPGQTVHRWVGDQQDRNATSYLDLETGRVASLPAAYYDSTPPGKDAWRWQDAEGMDVIGDIRDGLLGLKTRFAKVPGEWDTISASQVTGVLEQVQGDPNGLFLLPRIANAQASLRGYESEIHAFQTSDGAIGIIQIVEFDQKTERQQVRYKLVAPAVESVPDATNDAPPANDEDKELIGAWSGGQKVMQRLVLRADGTFELSYHKGPRIVDEIPESGVWSRDGKTLTLEITKSADKDRVGKKVAREVVYLTEKSLFLRAEDDICTHFTQARVFHGWTLLRWHATTSNGELTDFWEERPAGSESYAVRPDVDVIYSGLDGTVYYRADKKQFLIQNVPIGFSTQMFYGPFDGDPRELLNLPDEQAERKQSEKPRIGAATDEPSEDVPTTTRHVVTSAYLTFWA